MYQGLTLDQLRTLVSVAETGSFSAAGRRLKRVQSAVSTSMANLEAGLGVPLWDRSQKLPRLTEQGAAVLAAAQRVLREVAALEQLSAQLSSGLEPRVSLCLDALFPLSALLALCSAFGAAFPSVELRVDTQLMTAVSQRVKEGTASLGVVSPAGLLPGLTRELLAPVFMLPVASPRHPLAAYRGRIPQRAFADAIQIVLSERTEQGAADQAVLSARTWRVADLHTKHQMLRAGLGWGNLPEHLVREDLRRKRLVRLRPAAFGEHEHTLYLSAVYRPDAVLGPAHRFVLQQLSSLCARETSQPQRVRRKPT